MTRTKEAPAESLTLTAEQCAALLQIGRTTWYRMVGSGKAPRQLRLTGRWSRAEVQGWVDAGCPPRPQWEAMRADVLRGRAV